MADAHANFAASVVVVAPVPASSGVSLTLRAGDGSLFPPPPYNATVCPAGVSPTSSNAEIVRVTAATADTFTILRAQEGSTPRAITVGDQFFAGITAKTLTDIESVAGGALAKTANLGDVPNTAAARANLGLGSAATSAATAFDAAGVSAAETTRAQAVEVRAWAPSTVYALGQQTSFGTQIYAALTAHTSGATFNAANWTLLGSGAGGSAAIMDVLGDSIAAGVGVSGSDLQGFSFKLARRLGAKQINTFAHGGAMAHAHQAGGGALGDGGWGWFLGSQALHGYLPPQGWLNPEDSLPIRDLVILKYGHNDAADLGTANPRPYQEAMRNLISALLTCSDIDITDASWSFAATWVTANVFGYSSGPAAAFKYTQTLNDTATLTIPAGKLPAGRTLAIVFLVPPAADHNVGITFDGVAQTDLRLQGSVLCGQGAGGRSNEYVYRTTALSDGAAHTIVLTNKAQTTGLLEIDGARVEADPADSPIILVPNLHRCTTAGYTYFATGYANGGAMGDATIAAFNTALQSTLAEFPAAIYVDFDAVINKTASLLFDGLHPNSLGHSKCADACYAAIVASGKIDGRQSRTNPIAGGPQGGAFIGQGGDPAFANSWGNFGVTSADPQFRFVKDIQGRVYGRGAVKSGTSATATITTLSGGWRPAFDLFFTGRSSTGAVQFWKITTAGVVSIVNGGDTTRSELVECNFAPVG